MAWAGAGEVAGPGRARSGVSSRGGGRVGGQWGQGGLGQGRPAWVRWGSARVAPTADGQARACLGATPSLGALGVCSLHAGRGAGRLEGRYAPSASIP